MIIEKYIVVKPNAKVLKHYRDLGYDAKLNTPIVVKNEDVTKGSYIKEKIFCDCCHKVVTRYHKDIINTREIYGMDLCQECSKLASQKKMKETNLKKYGDECVIASEYGKNKSKETNLKKYGVENGSQSKEAIEKREKTNLEKYGSKNVFGNKEVQEKAKNTINKKYGVNNISQSQEIKNKKVKTHKEHYGVDYPMQNPEMVEKMRKTMQENNTVPTSSQQKTIFEMCKEIFPEYKIELNAPLRELSLDIKITTPDGINIDLEYDCWYWHQDKNRDRRRDEVVKKYGYKVIRIKSGKKIPTKEELVETIQYVLTSNKDFARIILSDWKENNKE